MSNFYRLCDRFPPPLVRLLARKDGRAMTTAQIAHAASMPPMSVITLSQTPTWQRVELESLKGFTRACGVDFDNPTSLNRIECYLRKNDGHPSFRYLTRDPQWKSYYLPLIVSWRKSLTTVPEELPAPIKRLLANLN
jgi:hypothetical protein